MTIILYQLTKIFSPKRGRPYSIIVILITPLPVKLPEWNHLFVNY